LSLSHHIKSSLSTCLSPCSINSFLSHSSLSTCFITFLSINFSLSSCLCHIRLFQLLSIRAALAASLDWLPAPWTLWTPGLFPASLESPEPSLTVWTHSSNLEPVSMPQAKQTVGWVFFWQRVWCVSSLPSRHAWTQPEPSLNLGGPYLFLNLFWAPAEADWNCLTLFQPCQNPDLVWPCLNQSVCLSIYIISILFFLFFCSFFLFLCAFFLLSFFLSFFLWFCLLSFYPQDVCIFLSNLSIYLPTYLASYVSVYLSFYLFIYLSIHLSTYLSIYLSICLFTYFFMFSSTSWSTCLRPYLSWYAFGPICLYLRLSFPIHHPLWSFHSPPSPHNNRKA
jgi:hypothetical protein